MSDNIDLSDLGDVRLNIIKRMLAEFPELKVQITKEIHIEGIQGNIRNYINDVAQNSNSQRQHSSYTIKQKDKVKRNDSLPLWVKLNAASMKRSKNGKYYVFK
jgi:LPS O-antigen subunit length determinant protein (WzzB/FepE family)